MSLSSLESWENSDLTDEMWAGEEILLTELSRLLLQESRQTEFRFVGGEYGAAFMC